MRWDESLHPRDGEGQFTFSSVGTWAERAAAELGRSRGLGSVNAARAAAASGEHPPGFEAARARHRELWAIPDRRRGIERTDAEQAELDTLEAAFRAYRHHLGLQRSGSSGLLYEDERGGKYTEHGAFLGRNVTDNPPRAARLGYQRVGDHPERLGSVEGSTEGYLGLSTHPDAGGLWIDPARPGTRYAPAFRNDMGHEISSMRPDPSPSVKRKADLRSRREGSYGAPEDGHETRRDGMRRRGRLGYGLHEAEGPGASAFVAHMKRVQPRVRTEQPKVIRRRTPRGTSVERWMGEVNDRMERGVYHG